MTEPENIQGIQIGAVVFRDPLTGEYEKTSHKLYLETDPEEVEEFGVLSIVMRKFVSRPSK